MLFWKRDYAGRILGDLKKIRNLTAALIKFEDKKAQISSIITAVKANIEKAKLDIQESAEHEKAKPWIDASFDVQVDELSRQEIEALGRLEQILASCQELISETHDEGALEYLVNEILKEEALIEEREKRNLEIFSKWEEETLRRRLSVFRANSTGNPPNIKTNDGVSWSGILRVVEQLGGWIECRSGEHICIIKFSNGNRVIACSKDILSGRVAAQIREQLALFLPKYKIPSINKLSAAFKKGDLHYAL
ncbi:hypothetical protein HY494_00355 [Candidatus Woesearchaeota archaeon]|nr:hypothetical protein [Candidatus Woesearchaeota archaeon]